MVWPFRATGTDLAAKTLLLSSSRVALGTGGPGCADGATVEVTVQDRDPARDFALLALQSDGGVIQIASSRRAFRQSVKRDPARYAIGADGAYHASVCYAAAGPAAILLVDSQGALDLGLRPGMATPATPAFRRGFAAQGRRQHSRVSANWVWIDGPAATGMATALPVVAGRAPLLSPPPRPGLPADPVRLQSDLDVAEANRRELDRLHPQKLAAAAGPALCRLFATRWKTIGTVPLAECIARGFGQDCEVRFVLYGDRMLRRYDGFVREKRGRRLHKIVKLKAC
ncbi:hypothetical protein [Sphingomonas aurantiaca]|uniref:hypothetical protein n=1 Tax=Sphingomonas aurantiaca TaxID=185949 RepID=UPI0033627FE7